MRTREQTMRAAYRALEAGVLAAEAKTPQQCNPFNLRTLEYYLWREGWRTQHPEVARLLVRLPE